MSQYNRYLRFLTALLPAGAFGLSFVLASSAAKATATDGEKPRADGGSGTFSVAAELQAIRDAVDEARSGGVPCTSKVTVHPSRLQVST